MTVRPSQGPGIHNDQHHGIRPRRRRIQRDRPAVLVGGEVLLAAALHAFNTTVDRHGRDGQLPQVALPELPRHGDSTLGKHGHQIS